MFHFPLNLSECAGKILLSIPTKTTWACSFHKNSCIIINSMQKYQQVCIHNIYMYVQYTLIQFTSLPLLICALIKTQSKATTLYCPKVKYPLTINSQNSQKELQKTMIIFKNYLWNNTHVPNKTNHWATRWKNNNDTLKNCSNYSLWQLHVPVFFCLYNVFDIHEFRSGKDTKYSVIHASLYQMCSFFLLFNI